MFRNGQYLEVIEASKDRFATVIVTVQEKTVSIKSKKITTNKWLQIEDWAELYKILRRAILRNGQRTDGSLYKNRGYKWKKSIRQLEITYTFEPPEYIEDKVCMPTVKVHVSPAKKKSERQETNNKKDKKKKLELDDNVPGSTKKDKKCFNGLIDTKYNRLKKVSEKLRQNSSKKLEITHATEQMCLSTEQNKLKTNRSRKYTLSDDLRNVPLEEYVPDVPKTKRPCADFKYVPSSKSTLQNMEIATNEYTPTLYRHVLENVSYVPNPIDKLKITYETYEPSATTVISDDVLKEYIPNSKGIKTFIEEYEPDFKSPCKQMKFDNSYVPSSVQSIDSNSSREKFKKSKKDSKHVRKLQ